MAGAGAALVEDADRPRVAELQRRLTAGKLRVLVAGEAKRGKSTLVNALLGEPVLPTGVLPLTAVATTVGYGETAEVLVRFHDSRVEQHPPARLLAGGLELVDTPGTGSVHAHNTAQARGALDRMDAAIFVVSAAPPISASERSFLRELRAGAVAFLHA